MAIVVAVLFAPWFAKPPPQQSAKQVVKPVAPKKNIIKTSDGRSDNFQRGLIKNDVFFRERAGMKSEKIDVLKKGYEVFINPAKNKGVWCFVVYMQKEGYVHKNFITISKKKITGITKKKKKIADSLRDNHYKYKRKVSFINKITASQIELIIIFLAVICLPKRLKIFRFFFLLNCITIFFIMRFYLIYYEKIKSENFLHITTFFSFAILFWFILSDKTAKTKGYDPSKLKDDFLKIQEVSYQLQIKQNQAEDLMLKAKSEMEKAKRGMYNAAEEKKQAEALMSKAETKMKKANLLLIESKRKMDDAYEEWERIKQYENKQKKKDPYSVLGVHESDSSKIIKEVYLNLLKVYHPDMYGINDSPSKKQKNELTAKIITAYEWVSQHHK
ncbi:MAG: DnaJ domain-containing protein [Desulfobacterales bacterium]|nr:DnaJ domain-containing protein [Desulfobacterales bacterium]